MFLLNSRKKKKSCIWKWKFPSSQSWWALLGIKTLLADSSPQKINLGFPSSRMAFVFMSGGMVFEGHMDSIQIFREINSWPHVSCTRTPRYKCPCTWREGKQASGLCLRSGDRRHPQFWRPESSELQPYRDFAGLSIVEVLTQRRGQHRALTPTVGLQGRDWISASLPPTGAGPLQVRERQVLPLGTCIREIFPWSWAKGSRNAKSTNWKDRDWNPPICSPETRAGFENL